MSNEWKNLTNVIKDLRIENEWDIRFVRIKIKEFERKKLIQQKEISGKKCYRILEKEKFKNGIESKKIENKPNVLLKNKEAKPEIISKKREFGIF